MPLQEYFDLRIYVPKTPFVMVAQIDVGFKKTDLHIRTGDEFFRLNYPTLYTFITSSPR